MKGKLDKNGRLWIERAGVWVCQRCKIGGSGYGICKHDCPAFREPRLEPFPGSITERRALLQLCAEVGTLAFDEFTDERSAE